MQHVLFKSAQLIAATFVQGNHDIHDDLCKYKAQSLHVFYKCWSAAELIAAKSDMMSAEQKKKCGGKQKKRQSAVFRRTCDKQAVAWSWEATSWPLVKAAWLLWVNIITNLLGLTSHVAVFAKKKKKYQKHHFEMTFWLQQNISLLQVCWQRGSRAHQAKWCQFLRGGDFSENSVSACCLAALNGRISQHWTMSFIRWSLTGDIEWHLGQLRVLPGAGCRMWMRRDFKYLKTL